MKKNLFILFVLSILMLLISCRKTSSKTEIMLDSTNKPEKTEALKIDYDLSSMNFTMISSMFFQMVIEAEKYENKNFKIKGIFQTFPNPDNPQGLPYFSVIINDVTMCCQEGIDFVWQGNHKWPEDYPKEDQEITIIGKYIVTETDDFTYNYILASDILL